MISISRRIAVPLMGLLILGAALGASSAAAAPVRILFIGNSYTAGNGLAERVAELGRAAGFTVEVAAITPGGRKFYEHVKHGPTLARIDEGWNYVVLQEQSLMPAFEQWAERHMIPAAKQLGVRIRAGGAEPVLFMTWARRDPAKDAQTKQSYSSYAPMQERIRLSYETAARAAGGRVAAVGLAWSEIRRSHPRIELYAGDGSHPSPAGSYLAACVLFAEIFQHDPVGLPPLLGLSRSDAAILQSAARAVVTVR